MLAERMDALEEDALVSVATEYGEEILPDFAFVRVRRGRLDQGEMLSLIREEGILAGIDATHPYASEVTRQIRGACHEAGIPVIRCLRNQGLKQGSLFNGSNVRRFPNLKAGISWLEEQKGNILAVTGSKELEEYAALSQFQERVFARVLPTAQAVETCRGLGLSGKHIIAVQGPFSVKLNQAMIEEYGCRFLVTKDGGPEGGMSEKLEAAARAGIATVVIDRPFSESGLTVDEVMDWYGRQMRKQTGEEKEGLSDWNRNGSQGSAYPPR